MSGLANFLTVLRIIVCPIYIWLFMIDQFFASSMVFLVGALTDYYDGYLARKYGDTSTFGAFLDPIADKVLVLSALFMLAAFGYIHYWMVWIIVARDVLVTLPRLWGVLKGKVVNRVSSSGKAKTALQMTMIFTILFYIIIGKDRLVTRFTHFFEPVPGFMQNWYVFDAMMLLLVIVTVQSGVGYLLSHKDTFLGKVSREG